MEHLFQIRVRITTRSTSGWRREIEVPTFYLRALGEEHAEDIARNLVHSIVRTRRPDWGAVTYEATVTAKRAAEINSV